MKQQPPSVFLNNGKANSPTQQRKTNRILSWIQITLPDHRLSSSDCLSTNFVSHIMISEASAIFPPLQLSPVKIITPRGLCQHFHFVSYGCFETRLLQHKYVIKPSTAAQASILIKGKINYLVGLLEYLNLSL